jgi:2'-5' RNA ligase
MDKRGVYEYSSVQINLPKLVADQIIKWGQDHISDEDLYDPPNDFLHGREDEIHVTILYGIHSSSCDEVYELLSTHYPFEVKLGQVSLFTTDKSFDVVKIEADSPSLFYLNRLLRNNVECTQMYKSYSPHVTIAYTDKNRIKIKDGGTFKNWRWTVNTVIFSSKDGTRTPIRLNTSRPVKCC